MTFPPPETPVPARVRALAGGDSLVPAWRNERGGLTFRAGDRYIKWIRRDVEIDLAGEAARLEWAARFTRVPRVVTHGGDAREEWLVTRALPGWSAVSEPALADPAVAVRAVGEGLRALHDTLPVAECPWDWGVPARIAAATERGVRVPDALRVAPPIDRLVVCHGDACCPNTLLDEDGWTAHVDLGSLGVADRWADIAVAAMSTVWNYGPGWEDALVEAYGVRPDRERMAYYQALWNAT
ncbi:aminoglycoside 3'-phosphotransferase [Microbacterium sp. Marseille-Q6965]|uniref:aminoglycoside 3'-phosphotransferase n=1 Tax=Microbacterium sp. Marseille-Q6965 TaxID=2965072 RepID=UPI0021B7BD6C|nr:aminoglycoside 3'-phosphotransferase [Microbacterium sp. Marseille-Q6965]